MPGATLTSVDGSAFAGAVKVRLGPISLQYKGSGEFTETDESARLVKIKASGKDARGNGTATADVTVKLSEKDGVTTGAVVTDLSVTGKPAQFGRGMIGEVSGRILDTFASNLAKELGQTPESPETAAPADTASADSAAADQDRADDSVDLLQYAGSSVLKRALPLIIVAVLVVIVLSRRRRR
jgi:carbon monoxide dehydrogenase subunit G